MEGDTATLTPQSDQLQTDVSYTKTVSAVDVVKQPLTLITPLFTCHGVLGAKEKALQISKVAFMFYSKHTPALIRDWHPIFLH